ncbi:putative Cytochrome P450 [Hibiscus syriacus]|uniref:Cytochrome P450 n=1 Tax=Hibiscus syriacus TaxID=106335 RepID=A0A6A2YHM7_HIBSY|nr:putative Cytochrome P450 [Hibiscus syriacus]
MDIQEYFEGHKQEDGSTRSWKNMPCNRPSPPPKRTQTTFIILSEMADKYSPIFTIKMGVHRALIVSDHETAKECLTINDKAFASRPSTLSMELLIYNRAMFGFAPYGNHWRQMRKLATIELLSNYRLDQLRHVRQSEIKTSLKELYQLWDEKNDGSDNVLVEMKKWFANTTLNMILRMIVGKRIPSSGNDAESETWKKALKQFFELSGKFGISDALPYLRWLDIGGDERLMKKRNMMPTPSTKLPAWLNYDRRHKEKKGDNVDFVMSAGKQ